MRRSDTQVSDGNLDQLKTKKAYRQKGENSTPAEIGDRMHRRERNIRYENKNGPRDRKRLRSVIEEKRIGRFIEKRFVIVVNTKNINDGGEISARHRSHERYDRPPRRRATVAALGFSLDGIERDEAPRFRHQHEDFAHALTFAFDTLYLCPSSGAHGALAIQRHESSRIFAPWNRENTHQARRRRLRARHTRSRRPVVRPLVVARQCDLRCVGSLRYVVR